MNTNLSTISSELVTSQIVKSPLLGVAAQSSAELLAKAGNAMAWLPETGARAIGVGNLIDILPDSNINTLGALDDYKAGFGNEDATLDIRALFRKYRYPLEEHEVVTEDGYILTLFRIPGRCLHGTAVLLMHGILGSADDYVTAGPDNGLAYLLANECNDVWIGNVRGNKHARRHLHLSPSEAKFWDFSYHEMGVFDVPGIVDYVLEKTNATSLKYIGYSQGTTIFFVMTSERPEYNQKVAVMVALAPVAYFSNVRSPLVRFLAPGTPFFHSFMNTGGLYEVFPDDTLTRILKQLLCGNVVSELVCINLQYMFTGLGYAQFNFTNLSVFLGHNPSGASAKQINHYAQGIPTGEFRQYDYGRQGNIERYGAVTPPNYALGHIECPISLFYSDGDWLANSDDVGKLYDRLRGPVDVYKIPHEQFNHYDFLWGKDFRVLVYKRLREVLAHF